MFGNYEPSILIIPNSDILFFKWYIGLISAELWLNTMKISKLIQMDFVGIEPTSAIREMQISSIYGHKLSISYQNDDHDFWITAKSEIFLRWIMDALYPKFKVNEVCRINNLWPWPISRVVIFLGLLSSMDLTKLYEKGWIMVGLPKKRRLEWQICHFYNHKVKKWSVNFSNISSRRKSTTPYEYSYGVCKTKTKMLNKNDEWHKNRHTCFIRIW